LHDPPYGIDVVQNGGVRSGVKNRKRGYAKIIDDDKPFDPAHLVTASEVVVLWGANHYADKLAPSAEYVVWVKIADEAKELTFSSAELAWVTPPSDRKGHVRRVVGWSQGGVMDGEGRLHPTQKPIKVQRAPIDWYTDPGDLVADWYMGAGAVIIACEQTGRIGHGMDIAHAYLAATLERLSARGLSPRLVGEGA
jgi:hypothetical protein